MICYGQQDAEEVMLDSGSSLRLPSTVLGPILPHLSVLYREAGDSEMAGMPGMIVGPKLQARGPSDSPEDTVYTRPVTPDRLGVTCIPST